MFSGSYWVAEFALLQKWEHCVTGFGQKKHFLSRARMKRERFDRPYYCSIMPSEPHGDPRKLAGGIVEDGVLRVGQVGDADIGSSRAPETSHKVRQIEMRVSPCH